MDREAVHLQQLSAKLKQNLMLCAHPEAREPSVDAVHDVRTGTRRIEAILDALERSLTTNAARTETNLALENSISEAIRGWRKLLKKIRRAAGAVRDLDVHRGLLGNLRKDSSHQESGTEGGENSVNDQKKPVNDQPTTDALRKQADDLDAWLKHTRHDLAQPLMKGAAKWSAKLDLHLSALSDSLQLPPSGRHMSSPGRTALETFARLSYAMPLLAGDNLHDFRKGAKKARYLAETGGEDVLSGAVGKALKKLQDAIGDWHDWLVLADEAHKALGEQGIELTVLLERTRDRRYADAMKIAERQRGRLMGEWHASGPKRAVRSQSVRHIRMV